MYTIVMYLHCTSGFSEFETITFSQYLPVDLDNNTYNVQFS